MSQVVINAPASPPGASQARLRTLRFTDTIDVIINDHGSTNATVTDWLKPDQESHSPDSSSSVCISSRFLWPRRIKQTSPPRVYLVGIFNSTGCCPFICLPAQVAAFRQRIIDRIAVVSEFLTWEIFQGRISSNLGRAQLTALQTVPLCRDWWFDKKGIVHTVRGVPKRWHSLLSFGGVSVCFNAPGDFVEVHLEFLVNFWSRNA